MPNVLGLLFTSEFTKPIYSPTRVEVKITLRLRKNVIRLNNDQYWLYAANVQNRTGYSRHSSNRAELTPSPTHSSTNYARNTVPTILCFP